MVRLSFLVFCVEEYKKKKKMSTKDVIELFERYSVLEYIKSFYEVLYKNDLKYVVGDIDLYIKSRQNPIITKNQFLKNW